MLNKKMWSIVGVSYHATKRPKPDQSPYESIEARFASCSGLSVLLIDACRAVGVPARFVGTPLWSNKRGNHSWVEVWDGSQWQFTGACEYNPAGLGKAWFAGNAAKAVKDDPRHAIYASSWAKAETRFPLVWDLGIDYVHAKNVTDRYAGKKTNRVFIDLLAHPGGGGSQQMLRFSARERGLPREGPGTQKMTPMICLVLHYGAGMSMNLGCC